MESTWYIQLVGTLFHLFVADEDLGQLVGMKVCKTANMIKMMLKSHVIQRLEIKLFKREANDLCLAAPLSRSIFIQYWENHGFEDSTTSLDSEDSFGSNSESALESTATVSEDSDQEVHSVPSQMSGANNYEDKMLVEYNIGTVDIHVENLIPPHPSRITRLLDHEHVGTLIESFTASNCGQMVILQGMLTDSAVSARSLHEEGTGEVEVLGGNHTREALQTLHRKGMLGSATVKVNLYKPLPRMQALRIGYQHNSVLHDRKKPVSFIDKVRLMRECRSAHDMSQKQSAEWRESLVTVFGVKDRRKLQQSYGLHLSMAVLKPELWTKVSLAADKLTITEKFFRGLSRLVQDEDKDVCLNVLLSEGVATFKQKVKEFIDAGHVKGKRTVKKRKDFETAPELMIEDGFGGYDHDGNDIQQEIPDSVGQPDGNLEEKYRHLLEKYEELEKENSCLRNEVEELKEKGKGVQNEVQKQMSTDTADVEHKRRRYTKNMFAKGEKVMAFWRDETTGEEDWQEAVVLFPHTDGRCRVQWKSDGLISTAKPHELQTFKYV